MKNKEIIFMVEESVDGGYEAEAVGFPIFTQGQNIDEVKHNIIEAVHSHFDEKDKPSLINIRFLKEEVIAL
jgi:hypothetical protein